MLMPLKWGFVSNLVKIFPSLASRPLYLTGENYAGTYIVCDTRESPLGHPSYSDRNLQPYITKAYVLLGKPPTNLVEIAINNGAMGHIAEYEDANTVRYLLISPCLIFIVNPGLSNQDTS
jgi:carboxypeptidase D